MHRSAARSRPRRALLLAAWLPALLGLGLGLAGCSATAGGDAAMVPLTGVDGATLDAATLEESTAERAETSAAERSVIVTGWASYLVDDPSTAAAAASDVVAEVGGRIDARSEQAPTEYSPGSATLTLRVPADRLDEVLDALAGLGRVQSVSTNAYDVTVEVQDLDARIAALTASIDRLVALQAEATDVDALISLETAISDRQAQLESMQAQQRYYDDQVSMSTLTVDFVSTEVGPEPEPANFWTGMQTGWAALGDFLVGASVVVGVLVPWLIPIAVVVGAIWLAVRARRRRRAAASDAG